MVNSKCTAAHEGRVPGKSYCLLVSIKFRPHFASIKLIRVFDEHYLNETHSEKANRIFMQRYLHRYYIDPILAPLSEQHDLISLCES